MDADSGSLFNLRIKRETMNYKEKIRKMTDSELESELERVIERRAQGYQRLGRGDLMIEASIKLCDEAIQSIEEEKSNRIINSRKA
jgi:hypothetical protein